MRNIFTSDEKEIAESIFQNGYTERKFNFHEAVLVSKYFRFNLGYGDTRIKNALLCTKWITAPAQRNSSDLKKAWVNKWNIDAV